MADLPLARIREALAREGDGEAGAVVPVRVVVSLLVAVLVALVVTQPVTSHDLALAPPVVHPPSQGSNDVALGSSYAAAGPPPLSGGACDRSASDYPQRVAHALHLELTDVSCFGATTSDVLSDTQGTNAPQITAVNPTDRLVTLTIGGNDIRYVQDASACASLFAQGGCRTHPTGSQLRALRNHLSLALTRVVEGVRRRAPSAVIVFVTYPRIVVNPQRRCPALSLDERDASMVDSMGSMLEHVTVSVAHAEHALLADPYAVAQGHGPCADPSARWVSGGIVHGGVAQGDIVFHPTDAGRAEMASLVETVLHRP